MCNITILCVCATRCSPLLYPSSKRHAVSKTIYENDYTFTVWCDGVDLFNEYKVDFCKIELKSDFNRH